MRRRAKQLGRRQRLLQLLLLLLPAAALGAPDHHDLTTVRELTPGNIGKYSDLCNEDHDCTFEGSHCDQSNPKAKKCLCKDEFPATNHFDKCGIEPNSFFHVFNITISPEQLAKDYCDLRNILNKSGFQESILLGPEANHIGDEKHNGVMYIKKFLTNAKECIDYVTWHQYYVNGHVAKVQDFLNSKIFNHLSEEINSVAETIESSGLNISMWISATINESCTFKEQCEMVVQWTGCRDNRCVCIFDKVPVLNKDGNYECIAEHKEPPNLRYVDPAMIGILAGMALMFIIICVVLRLFSKARWRENRTIFNTPNARLMNVSLLRDNKLLHGQERRGSRASVRGPSRQPSMASLRAHSPNASQDEKILLTTDKGKRGSLAFAPVQDTRITENCTPLSPGSRTGSRRGSRGSSGNTSAVAAAAGKPAASNNKSSSPPGSNHHHQHHQHHHQQQHQHQNSLGSEPVLENVTVEILEDKS